MGQRQSSLLWLKDLIDNLAGCRQQLEWAEKSETIRLLTETMIGDLERCKRLCETLHRRVSVPTFV